jgi:protein-L-isoaspartate(D-aspartate) O-methyltransferase
MPYANRLVVLMVFFVAGFSCCADDALTLKRERMLKNQIEARGIKDPRTLEAMRKVPRHAFVPEAMATHAYEDSPLPIGHAQTISQPYIVAAMTELLRVEPEHVVLEVGTGSGYQAAVLAECVKHVYSIEIIPELARDAAERLKTLEYKNVTVKEGDGYAGWEEHAPFDGIIVTAGAPHVPQPLVDQLKTGARMVIPVGPVDAVQQLNVIEKQADGSITQTPVMAVRFVPLTGDR